jgi:hypothetical protein
MPWGGSAILARSRGFFGTIFGVAREDRPEPWLAILLRSTQELSGANIFQQLLIVEQVRPEPHKINFIFLAAKSTEFSRGIASLLERNGGGWKRGTRLYQG